ncbi:hypothetical protein [Candidatus Williamhamiltonella defendens]|uniref:hypothetical protein n=1 Tax=Candidatus Williamhamiltonella defendens TaxID=138072 RepID=UPI001F48CDD2|nr:hypothetical protein [Candidatus Hamiltonella defensa]
MCEKIKIVALRCIASVPAGQLKAQLLETTVYRRKHMHNYNNLNNVDEELQQILNASGDDPIGTNVLH